MRKNVKSLAPTLWIVIAAFIITIFAVWGGGVGGSGGSRGANTLVWVGKEKISADLYFQNLRQRLETLQREYQDLNRNFIQQLNIPQQVLEHLIQQELLLQTAREMGLAATPEEIREKIMSYPVFLQDGEFIGFEQYKRILEYNRIPISSFEQSLQKEIVIDKLIQVLTAGVAVTEDEIWDNYKKRNESAKLEFVLDEIEKIEIEEELSDAAIQAYFEENKEQFQVPEKREGTLIFLQTEDLKAEVEIEDSDIERYYKDNLNQFEEPEKIKVSRIYLPFEDKDHNLVRAEAQGLLDKVRAGEDFAAVAIANSKDEKAQDGGDWGLYDWKRLPSQEQDEIERLAVGTLSDLIDLDDGVSFIKIMEKDPPITKPLSEVRERIVTILEDQFARELAEKKISHLKKQAERESSLDVAAQKIGLKIRQTGLLKQGQEIQQIDPSGTVSQALFSLEEKAISDPVYTYKGSGIVQLKNIAPAHQATFEEAQEEAKKELIAVKKKEKALERLQRVRRELASTDMEILAQTYKLEYKTAEEHKREQYLSIVGENEDIDRLAFSLPIGEASEPVEFESGYVLLRVLDRKEVTREDFETNKKEEKDTLLSEKKNRFLQSYLVKLRESKGVKIKYDLFLKINSDILSRFEGE